MDRTTRLTTNILKNADSMGSSKISRAQLGKAALKAGVPMRKNATGIMRTLRNAARNDMKEYKYSLRNAERVLKGDSNVSREKAVAALRVAEKEGYLKTGTANAYNRAIRRVQTGQYKPQAAGQATVKASTTTLHGRTSALSSKISRFRYNPKGQEVTRQEVADHMKELKAEGSATSMGKYEMLRKQMEKEERKYRGQTAQQNILARKQTAHREKVDKLRGTDKDDKKKRPDKIPQGKHQGISAFTREEEEEKEEKDKKQQKGDDRAPTDRVAIGGGSLPVGSKGGDTPAPDSVSDDVAVPASQLQKSDRSTDDEDISKRSQDTDDGGVDDDLPPPPDDLMID